jgi:hypothetical protein
MCVLYAEVTLYLHYYFVMGFYKVVIKWLFYVREFLIKCTF